MDGAGVQFNLGQDVVPGASGQTFTVTEYKRTIDVGSARARTELTRTPNFAYFLGRTAQRQIQGIDGLVGYNVAANGTATRIAEAAASDRRAEWLRHPIVAAARRPGSSQSRHESSHRERPIDRGCVHSRRTNVHARARLVNEAPHARDNPWQQHQFR
jgi:hypothetical protein